MADAPTVPRRRQLPLTWLGLAPFVIFAVLFLIWPTMHIVIGAFQTRDGNFTLQNLRDLNDLEHLQRRMHEQLGIRVHVAPGFNEVRSMRGIAIHIDSLPGLCRKTRQSIPAAIRRGLENAPEIAYRLLDAHDLLRDA